MSFERRLELADEAATEALGAQLAHLARPGDVFALAGPLGSGKTCLARAFIRALTSAGEEVPSPTFTLVQSYETTAGSLHHFDLYRLELPDQAVELGIDDAFADGISLVEWPERLGRLLPARALRVTLTAPGRSSARVAVISGAESWGIRWT